MIEKTIYVRLTCTGERLDEKKLPKGSFEDIEEDFFGADVVTFRCPKCGNTHKSRRYG